MPFISEEIYQQIKIYTSNHQGSLMLVSYPQPNTALADFTSFEQVEWIKTVITAIRTIRSKMNISPGRLIPIYFKNVDLGLVQRIKLFHDLIIQIAKASVIKINVDTPLSATSIIDSLEIHIPLKGLIDIDAELRRLNKEQGKIEVEIARLKKRLDNQNFITNAPGDIISKVRDRLDNYKLLKIKNKLQYDKLLAL
jgi:valyl-tRNA synthetase